MDGYFAPELGLKSAVGAHVRQSHALAIVLPTTRAVAESFKKADGSITVIGRAGQNGVETAPTVLSLLSSGHPLRTLVVHTDQLYQPADATILALLPERSIFVSPVECILNDRYGFDLSIWTAAGMVFVPAKTPINDIIAKVAGHLKDCFYLGSDWMEAGQQIQRTVEYRQKFGGRQLRYLTSSIANAFMNAPENDEVSHLLERVGALGQSLHAIDTA